MNELTIQQVAIELLKPAEYNPRKWTEAARRGLTESLNEFGFMQPIVVNSAPNRRGVIIGGNFKLDIAKTKGMKTVPVVWVNIPDLKREKELNLRLNKNQGDFDNDLLAGFDEELLAHVGFDTKELDKIFNDSDEDDFDGDKEAEKIVNPISKLGDIYELGRHRLMCGDSANVEDVKKLLGGGTSRHGIYGPTVQRQLFRKGQEHLQHDQERRYGRAGFQKDVGLMVRKLQHTPESNWCPVLLLRKQDSSRV